MFGRLIFEIRHGIQFMHFALVLIMLRLPRFSMQSYCSLQSLAKPPNLTVQLVCQLSREGVDCGSLCVRLAHVTFQTPQAAVSRLFETVKFFLRGFGSCKTIVGESTAGVERLNGALPDLRFEGLKLSLGVLQFFPKLIAQLLQSPVQLLTQLAGFVPPASVRCGPLQGFNSPLHSLQAMVQVASPGVLIVFLATSLARTLIIRTSRRGERASRTGVPLGA